MKIYTRKGDDGTTGLLFGGRVAKNAPQPIAYGAVDEAQAFVGVARAEAEQRLRARRPAGASRTRSVGAHERVGVRAREPFEADAGSDPRHRRHGHAPRAPHRSGERSFRAADRIRRTGAEPARRPHSTSLASSCDEPSASPSARPSRAPTCCRISTGSVTCCGRWRDGKRASRSSHDRSTDE